MCGIVGIFQSSAVQQSLYDALLVLQHRGQDAAGIATFDGSRLHLRKDGGLVRDIFRERHMAELHGNMGIGHVRYPTAGSSSSAEAQPLYVNSPYGITLAHNGNLTNAKALNAQLFKEGRRHINTDSDSELLLNTFAQELQRLIEEDGTPDSIFKAVSRVHQRCHGGYAAVAMILGRGLLGFRDPHGIRPVVYGKRQVGERTEYMIASESVALDVLGFELVRDLEPGEAIFIDLQGTLHARQCAEKSSLTPCIFEFVYFARPDSIIDDIIVHKARQRMGVALAERIGREWKAHDIDVVIPIPDTSRTAALELANVLGVKYAEGFIKNRYIGRTFIMPGQKARKKSVRQKLNAIGPEFRGKRVLLVDDSIVRGTTSRQIVEMAREAGASRVYFASAAPPVRFPNVYGIDMPAASELIAHNRSVEEVCAQIGADRMIYQDLDDLIEAVRNRENSRVCELDTSVFDGKYVTGDVTEEYLRELETERNDDSRQNKASSRVDDDINLYVQQ